MSTSDVDAWLASAKARAAGLRCPDCGAGDPRPLVVGMPTGDLADAEARGDVVLGGCVVIGDVEPEWSCRRCSFEWASNSRWVGYQPGEDGVSDR